MRSISKHEGQRAVTFGWIEQWERIEGRNGEKDIRVLLTAVSVRGHDDFWIEPLDHLWVYTPAEWWDRSSLKRLDATVFCGTVFRYRRANGTIDFGVKRDFPAMSWTRYADYCRGRDAISWQQRKNTMDRFVVFNDTLPDYSGVFPRFKAEIEAEKRRIEVNLRTLEFSKGHGFDRTPELEIKARRSEAKGFC